MSSKDLPADSVRPMTPDDAAYSVINALEAGTTLSPETLQKLAERVAAAQANFVTLNQDEKRRAVETEKIKIDKEIDSLIQEIILNIPTQRTIKTFVQWPGLDSPVSVKISSSQELNSGLSHSQKDYVLKKYNARFWEIGNIRYTAIQVTFPPEFVSFMLFFETGTYQNQKISVGKISTIGAPGSPASTVSIPSMIDNLRMSNVDVFENPKLYLENSIQLLKLVAALNY